MPALSNIPEPTTAYRPDPETTPQHTVPLSLRADSSEPNRPHSTPEKQPDHQTDSTTWLILLFVAGGVLRIVLGLLGPIQAGLAEAQMHHLSDRAQAIGSGTALDAFALFDLLAGSALMAGIPGSVLIIFGTLLSLAAIPAAYVVGQTLTGRNTPGVLAGAVLALHPAVLTASISLTATSFALSLSMIGLALICSSTKRSTGHVIGGALLLGLAGLLAPLCWVIGLVAAPLAGRLGMQHGLIKAALHSTLVLLFAVGPVVGYRAFALGTQPDALLVEFVSSDHDAIAFTPTSRWLINVSDASLTELGDALMLPLEDAGKLTINTAEVKTNRQPDPVADLLADAWVLMNTALACLAFVSAGVMLIRGRWIQTLALALPIAALAFCVLPPGESLRLPMIGLIGALSLGLLASRPITELDDEALAKRTAKQVAKLAAKEEKQRAKEEKRSSKQLAKLYAFDPPQPPKASQATQESQSPGILTERIADASPLPARPI